MPRWRMTHVKIVESFDFNQMPDDFTRLLWVLLPLALDKEGRGIYNTGWIKAKVMPLRTDVDLGQVGQALDWFVERGMLIPYSVEGRDYFHLPTFQKYQNTRKEAASEYPPPPEQLCAHGGASPDQGRSEGGASPDQGRNEGGASLALDKDKDEDVDEDVEKDEDKNGRGLIFRKFEQEIGPLTASVRDQVNDAIDDERYPDHWITEAINIAAAANKRSWRYALGVLKNWHAEGYDGGKGRDSPVPGGNGKVQSKGDRLAEMVAATEDL